MRTVSRIETVKYQQRPQQQSRSAEHDDRDGNLTGNDCAAQTTACPVAVRLSAVSADVREKPVTRQADTNPNRTPTTSAVAMENPAIRLPNPRTTAGGNRLDGMNDSGSVHKKGADDGAEQAAKRGQHQALGEQLRHDTAAPGAERSANRELARPGRAASQHQVGDISAAECEHQSDHAEEQHRCQADLATDHRVAQRCHQHAPGTAVTALRGKRVCQDRQVGLGRLDRRSRFHPADDLQQAADATLTACISCDTRTRRRQEHPHAADRHAL